MDAVELRNPSEPSAKAQASDFKVQGPSGHAANVHPPVVDANWLSVGEFVEKPVDFAVLREKVRGLLSGSPGTP